MSKPEENKISSLCERRINIEYLINGYSRENSKSTSFIPKSVSDVISYYYPSMNGHTFIWKIKNELSNYNDIIDSDVFNVGLPNNFFLRLQSNSSAIQRRNHSSSNYDNRGAYNHSLNRSAHSHAHAQSQTYKNNIIIDTDDNNHNNHTNHGMNERYDDQKLESSKSHNLILSLMSFPLPSTYEDEIFHVELYFHEINAQYSAIWNQNRQDLRYNNRYNNNYNNYSNYGQQDINKNEDDNYIKHGWVINYDLFKNKHLNKLIKNKDLNELTFECKINILRVQPYNNGYGNNGNSEQIEPYYYVARPLLFGKSTQQKNMKFIWNIVDRKMIDSLSSFYNRYKGVIQYHSDVYYDMFQFQIGFENSINFFQIQMCGFPENVSKIGIKLQLYAMDNKINQVNKIKIMSNIVTFSYDSPLYELPKEKSDILHDLLVSYQSLSILCIANIIQKYDKSGNTIQDKQEIAIAPKQKMQNSSKPSSVSDKEEIDEDNKLSIDAGPKWLEYPSESFIWTITDKDLLNDIKNKVNIFNSKIFKLLSHKWFIAIHKPYEENQHSLICVNCILDKGLIKCRIRLELLEINESHAYYEQFSSDKWAGGYFARGYEHESQCTRCLLIDPLMIKSLKKISIKVSISKILDETSVENKIEPNSLINKCNDNEIQKWLKDIVGLPQYYGLFRQQGIDDIDTVKLLTIDSLWNLGIDKVGHITKLIHCIAKLNHNQNDKRKSYSIWNGKELFIVVLIAVCFAIYQMFY